MAVIGANPEDLERLGDRFNAAGVALEGARRRVSQALSSASWHGTDAREFANRWHGVSAPLLGHAHQALTTAAVALRAEASEQRDASRATSVLSPLAAAVASAALGLGAPTPGLHVGRSGQASAFFDLRNASPAEVRAAWLALDSKTRTEMIARYPSDIGNRDGVSPADRIAANRIQMEKDLAAGVGDTDLLRRLIDSNTQVVLYRPSEGQIAIVHGNIENAKTVIVAVPGTGTTMSSYGPNQLENRRAADVAARAEKISGESVAVIAWLGYAAPKWNLPDNPGRSQMAEEGGVSLASFGQGLGLTDAQRVSVIGHSYGSTVVGKAVREGFLADNVIVLGSPGMGVNSVGELHGKDSSDVFAMRLPSDPVGGLGAFGAEPTSPLFGAQRLWGDSDKFFTHSEYWTGENLDQIAKAATDVQARTVIGPQTAGEGVVFIGNSAHIAGNQAIDWIQTKLPTPADGLIDGAQRASDVVDGVVSTAATEIVDVSVGAAKAVGSAAADVAEGALETVDSGIEKVLSWIPGR